MENEFENNRSHDTLRTRATLLFRLRDWKDGETWREFYDLYYNFVYRHARGSGLSHHESEEVTQEVFHAVAKNIGKFTPQPRPGSFRRWLGNLARWRVTDKQRERSKPSSPHNTYKDEEREDPLDSIPAPTASEEARLEAEWQQELYETAVKRLAQRTNPKHFQVFILHHREEWPLKRIATELKITRTSAYVINHRLKSQLQGELKTLDRELT
ncbi:sigma-70 family RNA polymerase sigma factor [Pelagicoccus albus]|uniref:Sigma-70 family RNA polymerase sigma factor n=1 Tax=Pelagicoccus albus TaxID=415222 RepID=A0A7X1B868_9BACT|nr:sigma-70 family RNA polymerase sigma factor [Pelagicoccus albus]